MVLAVVIAIGIGSLNCPFYRRMAVRGVSGQATVIELLPQMHDTVRYEYHVAGRAFRGQWQSRSPNPPSEHLAVGQSVVIYYDPENPGASVLGYPKPMLKNETMSVALAALAVPTFLLAPWVWKAWRKHEDQRVIKKAA